MNTQLASMTPSVFQLSNHVKINVELRLHAGNYVWPKKEIVMLSTLPNVLLQTTVWEKKSRNKWALPLPFHLTQSNVSRKNAQMNIKLVKLTAIAFQPLNNAKRNVEPKKAAGNSALLEKETRQLSALPNVPLLTIASDSIWTTIFINTNHSLLSTRFI